MVQPVIHMEGGYPSELSLVYIRVFKGNPLVLLKMIAEAWYYPDKVWSDTVIDEWGDTYDEYVFATCGWSGNEDLIYALRDNHAFWGLYWYQSRRGGLHWFRVIKEVGK